MARAVWERRSDGGVLVGVWEMLEAVEEGRVGMTPTRAEKAGR